MTRGCIFGLIRQGASIGFCATGKITRSITYRSEHTPKYPLKDARIKRDEIQTARAKGESPTLKTAQAPQTFSDVAAEWLSVRMTDKAENYLRTIHFRLSKYILPALGSWPLKDITSGNILHVCRNIEATGHEETAKRVKTIIGQIFRYAIAAGYTDTDPTSALLGALRPRNNKHYATITNPADIAILMRAIKAYPYTVMRCAMLFSVYTFARPGEVRALNGRRSTAISGTYQQER